MFLLGCLWGRGPLLSHPIVFRRAWGSSLREALLRHHELALVLLLKTGFLVEGLD